jgi:sec-independent protein translocase protein TatB
MFDMGFTEIMLISIVALVVIGPERLPGVARTAGKYFTKLRNFVMDVRADVESELKADELREILTKQEKELNSLKDAVKDVGKDLNLSEDLGVAEIKKSIEDAMPNLDNSINPEPIAKTRPAREASAKSSSKTKAGSGKKAVVNKSVSNKKAITKKKASPKLKQVVKAKTAPGQVKTRAKAKAAPKKTKAVSKKAKTGPKTKSVARVGGKSKTAAKPKPEAESSWTSSIAAPTASSGAKKT